MQAHSDHKHILSPEAHECIRRVDAYSSLSVIASLLFGFALTVLFEFSHSSMFTSKLRDFTEPAVTILMCLVLVCLFCFFLSFFFCFLLCTFFIFQTYQKVFNAYAMIVMTFNYYVVHRFIAEVIKLCFFLGFKKIKYSVFFFIFWCVLFFCNNKAMFVTRALFV